MSGPTTPAFSPYLRRKVVSSTPLPDGSTLVYPQGGTQAFPLNETASLIWELCDGTYTMETIAVRLAEIYDASPMELEADVFRFVEELRALDLLEPES